MHAMMNSDDSSTHKSTTNYRRGGRGTYQENKRKEKTAREFYEMGLSAEIAWKQPDTPGRQKCYRLFKKWDNELLDNYNYDINDRQIIAKSRMILSYHRYIFKLEYQYNKFFTIIENHRKEWEYKVREAESKGNEPPKYEPRMEWEYFARKLILDIEQMRDKMGAVDVQPTVAESSEEAVMEFLKAKRDWADSRADKKNNGR